MTNPLSPLVLIVDADPEFRRWMTRVLEEAGFRSRSTGEAEEAAQWLSLLTPAAVVIDASVVSDHGDTLARSFRNAKPGLPMVVLSSGGEPEMMRSGYLGMPRPVMLSKPVAEAALVTAVRGLCGG